MLLMILLIHTTFSVMSLQVKKLRRQNDSAIDLSNVSPARGHRERYEGQRAHHGGSPLLEPTGIQIATKLSPGPTTREHREFLGVKTISFVANCSFHCLENIMLPVFQNLNYRLQRRRSDVLSVHRTKSSEVTQKVF